MHINDFRVWLKFKIMVLLFLLFILNGTVKLKVRLILNDLTIELVMNHLEGNIQENTIINYNRKNIVCTVSSEIYRKCDENFSSGRNSIVFVQYNWLIIGLCTLNSKMLSLM